MAIQLILKPSGQAIGTLTEEQLTELTELLEEEHEGDRDYYVDRDLLEFMEEEGADATLLALLRQHVPEGEDAEGIEIEWRRD